MPDAFIVGASDPNGGTYMAYQLGRILKLRFGYKPIAVAVGSETWDRTKHIYDQMFPVVSIPEMEATINRNDILVANPSFSPYMFGLRLPGTKISYVQGFNTFSVLDARFDHYVASSQHVQKFLLSTYGISSPVIPPYLESSDISAPQPWIDRPPDSVFTYLKGPHDIADVFFDRLKSLIDGRLQFVDIVKAMSLPRSDLLERIAACRFFLTLSPAEGFGLVPLEAMSLGTVVVGFDGFGGRQYFRHMENCAVSPYPDIEGVAAHLAELVENPIAAAAISERGRDTSAQYTWERFSDSWESYLTNTAGLSPLS